jgi:hypothetical protein
MTLTVRMEFKVGDTVTAWRVGYRCDTPEQITTITSISPRLIKTANGSRWNAKRGHALTPDGRVIKTRSIRTTKDSDERTIKRVKLAEETHALLSPTSSVLSPLENLHLLSDVDLKTLAEISKRYEQVLKAYLDPKSKEEGEGEEEPESVDVVDS